uniref:Uncharacterized protein n=1 Tax=Parascaris univalens TaxID=6257 RepID=A0A915CG44_PARUN
MPGYRGKQCELVNDPNIYFSRQQEQLETAALSTLVTAVIVATCIVSVALYLYRRFMKYGVPIADSSSSPSTSTTEARSQGRGLLGAFRVRWQRRADGRRRCCLDTVHLSSVNVGSSFLAPAQNASTHEMVTSRAETASALLASGRHSSSHPMDSVDVFFAPS